MLSHTFLICPAARVLWLDRAKCLMPNFGFGAEGQSEGHQGLLRGRLPFGGLYWQGPALGPFTSVGLSREEDPSRYEGEDGEALSSAEKALGW